MRFVPLNRFCSVQCTFNIQLFTTVLVLLLNLEITVARSTHFQNDKRTADIRFHLRKNHAALRRRGGGVISSLLSVSDDINGFNVPAKQQQQQSIRSSSHNMKIWECCRGGGRGDGGPLRIPVTSGQSFGQSSSSSSNSKIYPEVEDVTEKEREKSTTDAKEAMSAFLSRDSRNTFIVRVYSILSVQLVFTCAMIGVFQKFPALQRWMLFKGRFVPMLSLLMSSITCLIMASSVTARRTSPLKWKLLALFTLGESISVGFMSSFFSGRTVINALMSTAVATLTITLYTLLNPNPKHDLSQWGSGLLAAGMIFIVYGIIGAFSQFGILPAGFLPYNEAIYSLLGVTLFSLYLAYHTRLIISGKNSKYQLNENDYVFGAMTLYNDIIDIFIFLLRLLNEDGE